MASTTSLTLPSTKLELPFLSPQRKNCSMSFSTTTTVSSPVFRPPPFTNKIHFHSNSSSVSHSISKIPGLQSNGFLVHSSSSDYSVNNSQIDVENSSSSNDGANETQVQSRFGHCFTFLCLIILTVWNGRYDLFNSSRDWLCCFML